jgi:hypothetical protein
VLRQIVVHDERVAAAVAEVLAEYGLMYSRGAGSDADAATTIVYRIASASSSVRTTWAMVDCFWPIAL